LDHPVYTRKVATAFHRRVWHTHAAVIFIRNLLFISL